MTSRLDLIYRKVIPTKIFIKGWGVAEEIIKLREIRQKLKNNPKILYNTLIPEDYSITIIQVKTYSNYKLIEGSFRTPFLPYLPEQTPEEIHNAAFQIILPLKWPDSFKPICIHLAGTGDHYFWRRRNTMAKPLLKNGIGSIILENPFYGLRKPKLQIRSSLHYVSDIFVMGGCLIFECITLLKWCERQGYSPLGISGFSMGGHMASLAACYWPKPLVLVPCLSWSTASSAFTEGVLSDCIDWDKLQKQFFSNKLFCKTLADICNINVYKTHNTIHKRDIEAVCFMKGIMDEFTHLKNYGVPFDTSLITTICAKSDAYVPRNEVTSLETLWPKATVKYVDTGHIGAYLLYQNLFRQAIVEAFQKVKKRTNVKVKEIL